MSGHGRHALPSKSRATGRGSGRGLWRWLVQHQRPTGTPRGREPGQQRPPSGGPSCRIEGSRQHHSTKCTVTDRHLRREHAPRRRVWFSSHHSGNKCAAQLFGKFWRGWHFGTAVQLEQEFGLTAPHRTKCPAAQLTLRWDLSCSTPVNAIVAWSDRGVWRGWGWVGGVGWSRVEGGWWWWRGGFQRGFSFWP